MSASSDRLLADLVFDDGSSVRLRLDPDPSGSRPSWLRLGDRAIAYDDRCLDPRLEAATHALRSHLRGRPAADPLPTFAGALAEVLPGSQLRLRRRLAPGQEMPPWPRRSRPGFPRSRGTIWPFDPEVAAFEEGLRRVLKRDATSDEGAARDRAWLGSHGLESEELPPDPSGYRVILAAAEPELLRDAVEAERAIQARGKHADDAVVFLGEALGYPSCCVARFLTLNPRDDVSLAAWLLPPLGGASASCGTLWLTAGLALLSHSPCDLDCSGSLALALRIGAAVDRKSPGFFDAWRERARAVHAVDPRGRLLRLDVEGPLRTPATCVRAERLEVSVDHHYDWVEEPSLAGASLLVREGRLVVGEGALVADLAADHRAPA